MLKKVLIGAVALVVVLALGLFIWARTVFTQDTVRVALAGQLSKALGQPVTVGGMAATIYPRVTVRLEEVAIGEPARIHVHALDVGTDFGALLSRRIEHADLHLSGARIELPLPPLAIASSAAPANSSSGPPVEIVSIDEIVLKGVEIVSGGRTLKGDVEVVPHGNAVTIRKVTLTAEDTSISATGNIADIAGPTGDLTIKAATLNVDKLLAFANDFSAGAGLNGSTGAASSTPAANSTNMTVSLDADRATVGALAIDKLTAHAILKGQDLRLEPLAFNLFGGRYEGTLGVRLAGNAPAFRWKARVSGIDVAAAAAFAGNANTISGRLAATIDLAGSGADATGAMKTARGTVRLDITNGVINNLGLVRAVVAATSMNTDAVKQAAAGSHDEPFTRLGGTLTIANGSASTQDLRLESNDLTLSASGALKLDGSAVNMQGQVQLSEALSRQAGSAVLRASQQNGRVTVPATITGMAGNYAVKVDAGTMAKRALKNEINDQTQQAIKKGLGGLFKK